jgi:hypothetical protein
MEDLRYILGMPIEIEGFNSVKLHPMNIYEFSNNRNLFSILNVGINLLLQQLETSQKEERKKIKEQMKDFDVLCMDVNNIWIFSRLLKICFKIEEDEDLQLGEENGYPYILIKDIDIINRDNYDLIKKEILRSNYIRLPKVAATKELQEWFDAEAKSNGKSDIDMQDILTSVMVYCGYTPTQLKEFTVYQINQIIGRINKICEYKSNIQFLCAGADSKDIKIDSGIMAHIDDSIEEKEITVKDSVNRFNAMLGK